MISLKVGFDFHGVITKDPVIMSTLMSTLMNAGHEVHLMTGAKRSTFDKEVKELGIEVPFTHFFSISDSLMMGGCPVENGDTDNPMFGDDVWKKSKAEYARHNNIDLMIDDEAEYGKYFTTPFMLYKGPKNNNLLGGF